jgi:MFS transporter, ACS family, pantothenate transporter
MALWMASRGYTLVQQNTYPTGIYATAIVGTVVYAVVSDRMQSRRPASMAIGLTFVAGSAVLTALQPDGGDAAHLAAFYQLGTTFAPQALWYAWMADVTAHDVPLRAVTTGFMNSFDFCFVTWWPLVFYPVTDAPDFRRGYVASVVTGALVLPFIGLIAYLERRDRRAGKIGMVSFEAEDQEGEPGFARPRPDEHGEEESEGLVGERGSVGGGVIVNGDIQNTGESIPFSPGSPDITSSERRASDL